MEYALPASVDFTRKQPELPDSCTSTLMAISPNNGLSFGPGQPITFDLPSRAGLFIDGKSVFIRYKITYTSGATAGVIRRKPVYTTFSRLDEYIGGVPVNTVPQYNQVSNMYIDVNYSFADVLGQQYSWGLNQALALSDLDGVTLPTAAGDSTFYLAAPLVCSFLQGTDKLYPTGASAPIRIQLTVDTITNMAVVAANVTNIVVSQPELCFSTVDLGYQTQEAIFSASPQLFIKTKCWANGTQGMPAGSSGQMSLVYNHRYQSLENLYLLSTTSDVAKGLNLWGDSFNALGTDTTAGTVQVTIGQSQIPQIPLSNLTGGRAAIQQYIRECTGTLLDQRNTMSIYNVNFQQYANGATASTADLPAKFIVAFPLSRLNPPSPYQSMSLLTGVSAQQTPIIVNLTSGSAFNSNMIFNLIAEYSAVIAIDTQTKQAFVTA